MGRPSGKRDINHVDLTSNDGDGTSTPGRTPKYPRAVSGQRFGQDTDFVPLSQSSQNYAADDDEEEHAADQIMGTQGADDEMSNNAVLYGEMPSKIVGVRFYNGHATIGEHVILRREPHNPYDRNAIQVLNVMGAQIGHIPRFTAAKLAGYMVGMPRKCLSICGFNALNIINSLRTGHQVADY
ncbi:HIRAN domain-containing protein [Aspergillus melleus]|uniref:HIRAN domain-containing protein n=1 Tax=Aspergillus melleus TaxID=138277 RepID=UPI001E8E9403|nr:uncharacterized protein LDX57_008111 [Aspergillus melleus]KAH8430451.1 hypothetical protein LDX57_008111 [Aspergillus melleus]